MDDTVYQPKVENNIIYLENEEESLKGKAYVENFV